MKRSELKKQIHLLKIKPEYFNDVLLGIKKFEVRFNDRNFKIDDLICLREFNRENYTGRNLNARIIYILDDPEYCKEGYVVLGIETTGIVFYCNDSKKDETNE